MPKNIIDKIWESHVISEEEGCPAIFAIDMHYMHEVTTPQAFSVLRERGLKLWDTGRCIATVDHNVSTSVDRMKDAPKASQKQLDTLRNNCSDFDVKLLDMESGAQGIVHVVGPEQGLTQPGMTIVCGDSHTSTHGAFGALAFGIGTTEISHVMASGCMLQSKPKTMKVEFVGTPGPGITAKDLVLKLIAVNGIGGGTGYIMEYTGDIIKRMSMEGRMTICNMSIEGGARAGLVSPDEITYEYLKNRAGGPSHDSFDEAVEHWSSFATEEGATYDKIVTIDIEGMSPMVTWGTNPEQGIEITETIPTLEGLDDETKEAYMAALEYTQLKPGQSMVGLPIDYVFIGSCTNARLKDLEAAASIFENKKVAEGVTVLVVPGSEKVKMEAEKIGLDKIFINAGAQWRNPGCSSCLGMNEDKVPAGKRCASTSNRNFVGRQGPGSITHLMSPEMAANAAIAGRIEF